MGVTAKLFPNENNDDKVNTYKYNAIYSKLQEYGSLYINDETNQFNTNVIIGNGLKALCNQVKDYKKRDILVAEGKGTKDNLILF